jgi:DNA-binding MarR family transcriptional regulator
MIKHSNASGETVKIIDLDHYLPFLIVSISNNLYRSASRYYQSRFGIGVTEWRVLTALAAAPNSTANRLCEIGRLDKAAASRSLKVLESSGHVAIARHKSDARKRIVAFTPAGRSLYEELIAVAKNRQERVAAGLTAQETDMLIALLTRVRANSAKLEE